MIAALPAPAPTTIRLLLFVVVNVLLAACTTGQTPTPSLATPQPSTMASAKQPPDDALAKGSSFQTHTSARFNFSLPLPDGASFRIDDQTERWFVATHERTASTLVVRAWREYEIMNRSSCEARARLYRTFPERERSLQVEERRIDVPPGHDTIVDVRMRELTGSPRFEGAVLAFGGWAHQCFAFVFVTRGDVETTVTGRLSTIVQGSLERMKFTSDLDPKRTPPDLKTPLHLEMTGVPLH